MTQNHTFFRYCLVPEIGQGYLLEALWEHCLVDHAMENEGYSNRNHPVEPQPEGWAAVVAFLDPIFNVEVEAGYLVVLPGADTLYTLSYAHQHLRHGVEASEVIAKLDRLGTTFIHDLK